MRPPTGMRRMATARARNADPVSVVITCKLASAKAAKGSTSRAKAAKAAALCVTGITPSARKNRSPVSASIQRSVGSHAFRLEVGERGGRLGPVAQQIAAGEMNDIAPHLRHILGDAIDGGDGELRQRHRRGVDPLGLRRPFLGNGLCKSARRHEELTLLGRPHGPAVELDREAIRLLVDRHLLVEPLRQRRGQWLPAGYFRRRLVARLAHAAFSRPAKNASMSVVRL